MLQVKLNLLLLLFMGLLLSFHAQAENSGNQGKGIINMRGAVIETACGIAIESLDQTIDMGISSISNIIRDGKGGTRSFNIKLENCVLPDRLNSQKIKWHHFSVTFDGNSKGSLFDIYGDAHGVGLTIFNSDGQIAIPGKAMPLVPLEYTHKTLNYSIRLVSNSKSLKAGKFFSAIKYKLDYY